MRQRLLAPGLRDKLEVRLRRLAVAPCAEVDGAQRITNTLRNLEEVREQLDVVTRNLALADTVGHHRAIAVVFDELAAKQKTLESQLAATHESPSLRDPADEVTAALKIADNLIGLAEDVGNLGSIGELLQVVNARPFLKFRDVKTGMRTLRKPSGGIVTFGNAAPPIKMYDGPTGRTQLKEGGAAGDVALGRPSGASRNSLGTEGYSSGNVNRGDRI